MNTLVERSNRKYMKFIWYVTDLLSNLVLNSVHYWVEVRREPVWKRADPLLS